MHTRRKLPDREHVFITSLMYHGFRLTSSRTNLKFRSGYVIPATRREDSGGIDAWVKMPRDTRLVPIQITQRGLRLFRKHQKPHGLTPEKLEEFQRRSDSRLRTKRAFCRVNKIAFVLVRDFDGRVTNTTLAWGDIKALRYAISRVRSTKGTSR